MLDIKLKSSKTKYISSTIILLILVLLSSKMYFTYTNIGETAKKYEYNIFEKPEFLTAISFGNYSKYFDIMRSKENNNLNPADVLLNLEGYDESKGKNQDYKEMFNGSIIRNLDSIQGNLESYVIKNDINSVKEINQGGINILVNEHVDDKDIKDLNKKYSFYIVIKYDENGKRSIDRIYGADRSIVATALKNSDLNNFNQWEMKPIKDMSYVYAVPRELTYNDSIASFKDVNEINSYRQASLIFIEIALLFILVLALITPYKISKELIGFEKVVRIPIEVSSSIIFITLMIIDNESYHLIRNTISFSKKDIGATLYGELTGAKNIIYWIICFSIIFMGGVIVKHIFKTGIKQYIKESSLIYKVLIGIKQGNKRLYNYLRNIDLKEKNTKKITLILGINSIVLSIITILFLGIRNMFFLNITDMLFWGIIVAIIYTVILFIIIRKKYEDISNNYNKLFEAITKIAKGNIDVTIEENLGIFNDFKKEIESIQKGFKKAVNEEVKSQKMKTELISNVSHDLKTPLTSIITYIDLLKDENLSAEKHKEYLDTLDRKSQRLQELIEDLFEVSKATSGNINLNIVEVDIVALMKQTLLELDDKIVEASLVVKTRYPEGKVILHLDSQRMFRVFENLILNITKYAMKGSRVYIDIIFREEKVEITLKNMTANEIDFNVNDIVERFVRGDKARNTEGSGLGLAIAKSFVELQGGQLNINVDGDLFKVTVSF